MGVDAAYALCEDVTREQAANFYYGIRLLPGPKRRALCAVYAFARRVDDVGDGDLPPEAKLSALEAARADLDELDRGMAPDPVLVALRDARGRYPIPLGPLRELVDGVEMDVHGARYAAFDDLLVYCRRVASSVGRLCVAIFGVLPEDEDEALRRADALGVAMQLTNILRDVREDLERGRVYLPAEDLERHGCDLESASPAGVDDLVRFEAGRAREWFAEGLGLLPLLDRRSAATVAAMAGIYLRILTRIEADPGVVVRRRVSLAAWEKAWIAMRSLAGRAA